MSAPSVELNMDCAESRTSPAHGVKKTRGKYSSRACVQCRKRKLKCSGGQPCHRCFRSRQPCLFTDDPVAAAEALRRSCQPVHDPSSPQMTSRRVKAADVDLAARMAKVESTLEALVRLVSQSESRDSVEPQQADDNSGFQGETAFQAPVDAFNANLASLREKLGYGDSVSPRAHENDSTRHGSQPTPPARSRSTEPLGSVRLGSRQLPFPVAADYARYRDFIFDDINPCHPCINEADFHARSRKLLATGVADPSDACVLALNYILFACTDILTDTSPAPERSGLPGWRWYHAADELMRKRKLSGRGDLTLVQYLVYEALYLTHADRANAAYNVAGLACRLCFQFGLHQQKLWGPNCTPFWRHMRQRLFWTVYFLDRRISLSCGRPYAIRDSDVDVDLPAWIDDKALYPDQPLPDAASENNYNAYLSCMVAFARFAGEIWDQIFSAAAAHTPELGEKIAILDTRIRYWLDTTLPSTPLLPSQEPPTTRQLWQHSLVRTRMNHLRLLLRRRTMVSLAYGTTDGLVCGRVAMDIVRDIRSYAVEADKPSSYRFHMAISLGNAVLILATLLCRDLSAVDLQGHRPDYAAAYRLGMATLRDLAANLRAAGRIVDDLRDIAAVVDHLVDAAEQNPSDPDNAPGHDDFSHLVPANIDDLFSHGLVDPLNMVLAAGDLDYSYGASAGTGGSWGSETAVGTVQDAVDGMATTGWDSWGHYEPLRASGGHGVPWV